MDKLCIIGLVIFPNFEGLGRFISQHFSYFALRFLCVVYFWILKFICTCTVRIGHFVEIVLRKTEFSATFLIVPWRDLLAPKSSLDQIVCWPKRTRDRDCIIRFRPRDWLTCIFGAEFVYPRFFFHRTMGVENGALL